MAVSFPDRMLVTGGAGFIGSNFVARAVEAGSFVVNLDALTYAGNPDNLAPLAGNDRHLFVRGDILERDLVLGLLREHRPSALVHFAAESHVDRSIDGPGAFVRTNVVGTFELLEAARAHLGGLPPGEAAAFRFVHVSTDEVYGSLGPGGFFREDSPYAPNSPYAASKAGADHLVRAYHETYRLNAVVTHCGNNYGPYQFPEKLIPLVALNALEGKPLPVYGDGQNVRDWIYVGDHCEGVAAALARGRPGEAYNFGARGEMTNLALVHALCDRLDALAPPAENRALAGRVASYRELVTFVQDRPGHDRRYAIDPSKAEAELGWRARHGFDEGLELTLRWYLANRAWCERIAAGTYRRERLGLAAP
ncbi:MAG TPA: dTDP-glucose 4,6-dehydratase [Polyangiaceae bacterium]|nr:dTDP-glucose 4,6-dehydratase [Polyangiaceae bacterium]